MSVHNVTYKGNVCMLDPERGTHLVVETNTRRVAVVASKEEVERIAAAMPRVQLFVHAARQPLWRTGWQLIEGGEQ